MGIQYHDIIQTIVIAIYIRVKPSDVTIPVLLSEVKNHAVVKETDRSELQWKQYSQSFLEKDKRN